MNMSTNNSKIALLTLATSKQRDNWVSIKDSYLYNMTLKTFLLTMDKEHEYIVYIGIDKNDRIFDKTEQQSENPSASDPPATGLMLPSRASPMTMSLDSRALCVRFL